MNIKTIWILLFTFNFFCKGVYLRQIFPTEERTLKQEYEIKVPIKPSVDI